MARHDGTTNSSGTGGELAELAAAHGVATWYEDADGHRAEVADGTVIAVLGVLGVDASTPESVTAALAAARARADEPPPTIVLTEGTPHPLPEPGTLDLEDGTVRELAGELPGDLPLGWHRLRAGSRETTVIVVPARLPRPPRTWGFMLQLYALRAAGSWGMGDLGDLAEFATWSGREAQAGLILLNPLHAIGPTLPVPASPYSPTSRRFVNPLYLRVDETDAYRAAPEATRAAVDALRPAGTDPDGLIDYDAVWLAKRNALELLFPYAHRVDLSEPHTGAAPGEGRSDLATFATYCALAERHGPDWRAWPEALRATDGEAVAAARSELAPRIAFFAWLQELCERQLGGAHDAAREAGMPVGLVHDLAVGVDPGGADGWMLGDVLAAGVRVGAPPDAFNQLGQDWGLAAWRPDRLAATGYAAWRDLIRGVLRHAGGIRVDHIAGVSRLWWIPPGAGAAEGTYVAYDAEAMLGVLALEAARAGAVVVGEDLGTIQPSVPAALRARNMLGSTVMWFARDADGAFLPPSGWPVESFASLSTHDLPTAYGFLTGAHVRVRAERGLLTVPEDEELVRATADRRALLEALGLAEDASDDEAVLAMHAALAAGPSLLAGVSLYDVLGEVRQPNLPGTTTEYPNWRIPLPASPDEIHTHRRVRAVAALMSTHRPRR